MENINKSTNYKHKVFNTSNLKILLLKHLFLPLCLILIESFRTSRIKFILFTEVNQILLKVKGKGKIQIINPSYAYKPYIYYLNDEAIPKKFKNSEIDLPNSENKVNLIFDEKTTNCGSMFKGCSNITKIDLSHFISDDVHLFEKN